jgi:hypothetical protein
MQSQGGHVPFHRQLGSTNAPPVLGMAARLAAWRSYTGRRFSLGFTKPCNQKPPRLRAEEVGEWRNDNPDLVTLSDLILHRRDGSTSVVHDSSHVASEATWANVHEATALEQRPRN